MRERETSREIDEAAADWAARQNDAPLSSVAQQEFDAWIAGDTRRLGAYAKARAVMVHVERAKAFGGDFGDAPSVEPSAAKTAGAPGAVTSRRRLLGYGSLAAVVTGAAAAGLSWGLQSQRYQTKRGEVRRLPLADSSFVTLNTASSVSVDFTEERRSVRLFEGEALFEVAKDSARPFEVDAGDMLIRAVGTRFTVARLAGRSTQILLQEGLIDVSRKMAPETPPMRVSANTRVTAKGDAAVAAVPVAPADISRQLSWREGMLAFEDARLDDAAAEFARYSEVEIVVGDPAVAARTITGLFAANDPVGFARAVAQTLELHAETAPGQIVLLR